MSAVSVPVCVFLGLGWYDAKTLRLSERSISSPCANFGILDEKRLFCFNKLIVER